MCYFNCKNKHNPATTDFKQKQATIQPNELPSTDKEKKTKKKQMTYEHDSYSSNITNPPDIVSSCLSITASLVSNHTNFSSGLFWKLYVCIVFYKKESLKCLI